MPKTTLGGRKAVFRYSWLLTAAVTVAACSAHKAPTGASDLEILPPPPRQPLPEGYKPKRRPPESPPEVQQQAVPDYPESAVVDEVSCAARLLYHILEDGSATLVRLEWDSPPPPEHQVHFEESIREAIRNWKFTPAKKWIRRKMEDGSTRTVPQTIPKAGRAIVRFRVEDGEGIVE